MDCTFQSLPTWKFFFQLCSFNPVFLRLKVIKLSKQNQQNKQKFNYEEGNIQNYHWVQCYINNEL